MLENNLLGKKTKNDFAHIWNVNARGNRPTSTADPHWFMIVSTSEASQLCQIFIFFFWKKRDRRFRIFPFMVVTFFFFLNLNTCGWILQTHVPLSYDENQIHGSEIILWKITAISISSTDFKKLQIWLPTKRFFFVFQNNTAHLWALLHALIHCLAKKHYKYYCFSQALKTKLVSKKRYDLNKPLKRSSLRRLAMVKIFWTGSMAWNLARICFVRDQYASVWKLWAQENFEKTNLKSSPGDATRKIFCKWCLGTHWVNHWVASTISLKQGWTKKKLKKLMTYLLAEKPNHLADVWRVSKRIVFFKSGIWSKPIWIVVIAECRKLPFYPRPIWTLFWRLSCPKEGLSNKNIIWIAGIHLE